MTSLIVPLDFPGKVRFRFKPSMGETKAERARNMGELTTGTATTVPDTSAGWRPVTVRRTASMAGYSAAWTPAVRHSVGPGLAPWTITSGIWMGPIGVSPTVK